MEDVDDCHVQEWYGSIFFSFDGKFQGWVQVVDCSQFRFYIYSFDVLNDVIHVSGIQHSFSFYGIVKLAHPNVRKMVIDSGKNNNEITVKEALHIKFKR